MAVMAFLPFNVNSTSLFHAFKIIYVEWIHSRPLHARLDNLNHPPNYPRLKVIRPRIARNKRYFNSTPSELFGSFTSYRWQAARLFCYYAGSWFFFVTTFKGYCEDNALSDRETYTVLIEILTCTGLQDIWPARFHFLWDIAFTNCLLIRDGVQDIDDEFDVPLVYYGGDYV